MSRAAFASGALLLAGALAFVQGCVASPEPPTCAPGESLVPVGAADSDEATEACAPPACGTASWPATDAASPIYVAPWGGAAGPGTAEAPFSIVQRALGAAGPGDTVLVADGDYAWDLLATPSDGSGVTISGRCAELVRITPRDPLAPSLWVQGATLDVRGVTFLGGHGVQVMRSADGTTNAALSLRDSVIEGAFDVGLQAISGSAVDLTDVTIRGTRLADGGTAVVAVRANTGARLRFTRVELSGNMANGIEGLGAGTEVDLEDVVIQDTLAPPLLETEQGLPMRPPTGVMVLMENGAALTARGLTVRDNPGDGVVLRGASGPHLLEDVTISGMRDTYPPPLALGRSGGSALIMESRFDGPGMDVVARNLVVEDSFWVGISVGGRTLTADLDGVVVRDIRPSLHDGIGGVGLQAYSRATLTLRSMEVENTGPAAIYVTGGADVTLEDIDIRGTFAGVQPGGGIGLVVGEGIARATGLRISDSVGAGVLSMPGAVLLGTDVQISRSGMANAAVLGGELQLSDSTLSEALPSAEYGGGVGLFALDFRQPSRVVLENVTFANTVGPGLYLRGQGSFEVRDSTFDDCGDVRGTPGGVFATEGVAAWVAGEDDAPGTGLLLSGNTFTGMGLDGILLDGAGATLAGNSFSDVGGEPLFVQRCGDAGLPVDVEAQTGVDASCRAEARVVESLLLYSAYVSDVLTQ